MSILNSLKKALGFSDDDEYYDDDDNAVDLHSDPRPSATRIPVITRLEQPEPDTTKKPEPLIDMPEFDTSAISAEVFDSIIKLFNDIQPEFVRKCLNVEAQRAYIMDNIDKDLRRSLDNIATEARKRGEAVVFERQRMLEADMDKLKSDCNALKLEREDFQNAKLSASRQKRAMTDRITDLEGQISSLMAEREQYRLENRSMANKLRLANIRGGALTEADEAELQRIQQLADDNTRLTAQVEELSARLAEANNHIEETASASASDEASQQAIVAEIEQRLAGFEKIKERKNERIRQLQNELAEAREQEAKLTSRAEASEQKCTELHEEVKRLSELINRSAEPQPQQQRKHRPSKRHRSKAAQPLESPLEEETPKKVTISAIDELMDSTDWFTVPEPIPPKKDPEVEEDFGYKEPVKPASHGDSDKQLSLF